MFFLILNSRNTLPASLSLRLRYSACLDAMHVCLKGLYSFWPCPQ